MVRFIHQSKSSRHITTSDYDAFLSILTTLQTVTQSLIAPLDLRLDHNRHAREIAVYRSTAYLVTEWEEESRATVQSFAHIFVFLGLAKTLLRNGGIGQFASFSVSFYSYLISMVIANSHALTCIACMHLARYETTNLGINLSSIRAILNGLVRPPPPSAPSSPSYSASFRSGRTTLIGSKHEKESDGSHERAVVADKASENNLLPIEDTKDALKRLEWTMRGQSDLALHSE